MIGIKTGFVENYIEREIEKVWDAYLSVDVSSMTGYEKVPKLLTELLNKTTSFLALRDFFDQYTEREVYLTEDVLSFNDDYNVSTILRIINGKDILVHIRVRLESVDRVKDFFDDALEKNLNQLWILLYWLLRDDGYLIQIRKRREHLHDSFLRLYPDGSGVIITLSKNHEYEISYYQLTESVTRDIVNRVETKVDYIISHTELTHEDDREYGFAASLKYGLIWKYPDAEKRLSAGRRYEDKEYSDDEFKIKLAKQILSIHSMKSIW